MLGYQVCFSIDLLSALPVQFLTIPGILGMLVTEDSYLNE